MRTSAAATVSLLAQALSVLALPATPQLEKRAGYDDGQPIDANGKGAPLLGGVLLDLPGWCHEGSRHTNMRF